MISQNMASTSGAWCTFPSISAAKNDFATAAAPRAALANQKLSCWSSSGKSEAQLPPGAPLANQKLSCWSSSGQSEAQLLGVTRAVTVFCTKPPIMQYFSGKSSILLVNQRCRGNVHMMSAQEGDSPRADAVKKLSWEVGWKCRQRGSGKKIRNICRCHRYSAHSLTSKPPPRCGTSLKSSWLISNTDGRPRALMTRHVNEIYK